MNVPSSTINVYHLAGLDDQKRGFNRQAQVIAQDGAYQAHLRYETLQIDIESVDTEDEAIQQLIHQLHERGYTQLRTQRIFQGKQYLGNQELWVDYSDLELPEISPGSWLKQIWQFLGKRKKNSKPKMKC